MSGHKRFILGITLVVTLGGLLFGYDTAVISGTTGALEKYFVTPLFSDADAAAAVILQYKVIVSLCAAMILAFLGSFLYRLYGTKKAVLWTLLATLGGWWVLAAQVWSLSGAMTPDMGSSIKGFTISSALIGCVIGGALGGYVSQSIGRKKGLILAALLFLVSAVGSALPDTLNFFGVEVISSLIIYRIIGGVGVGIASMLSPMYIAEVAPAASRGRLVSLNQFTIIFGMLLVYFVNYAIALSGTEEWLNTVGWRWMFASEVIPAGLFLMLLFFVPETPRFMMLKGADEKALALLGRLHGGEAAQVEYEQVKASFVQKNRPWLSFGGMVLLVGILISFFQQAVGINVVLYYAPEILRTMGLATDASLFQTIIVGVINLSFTVVAILTVDRFGRKPLMILGSVVMAASMLLLGLTFYFDSVGLGSFILMLVYTAAFAVSWGPVAWVLISEIFPNSIRGAMAISVAVQWLSNFTVSWTFPILNENQALTQHFNHGFAYWIYAAMGILAALFIWKLVPETKGRSLEDMEKLWTK